MINPTRRRGIARACLQKVGAPRLISDAMCIFGYTEQGDLDENKSLLTLLFPSSLNLSPHLL
jgi:hypothetical protein